MRSSPLGGPRANVHNRAVPETPRQPAPDGARADIDAVIADSFTHAMAAVEAAHDAARMALEMLHQLAQLVEERSIAHAHRDGHGDAPASDGTTAAVPHDVLELASLAAQAAGVDVETYLRAAVLAYSADGDGSRPKAGGVVRSEAVRREARRVRAESRAVKAQSDQVVARMTTDDGAAAHGGPPKG